MTVKIFCSVNHKDTTKETLIHYLRGPGCYSKKPCNNCDATVGHFNRPHLPLYGAGHATPSGGPPGRAKTTGMRMHNVCSNERPPSAVTASSDAVSVMVRPNSPFCRDRRT
ncbi:hypothetical protein BaRGS_00035686 [Batillaria attramentaria]|uniref:Uncharacterized protein n=1 Tax=Batillaria attramentaria TaxID=370345 RepID=A0ABD0JFB6_9CAEN